MVPGAPSDARRRVAHRLLNSLLVKLGNQAANRSSDDPRQAFRLLRRLHLAAALWGRSRALPLAVLNDGNRMQRFRVLRALLTLEREGVVELHRSMRAVRLAGTYDEMPTASAA